ncbi:MAG: hypothetical protein MI861_16435 [Pirellulales bacterium]|nr:hypothetical protein [Pirellulales bacterium]
MSSSDSEGDQPAGSQVESGFLIHAREWTDLFPWLCLVRTLRVAASAPLILVVAITFAVWCNLVEALVGGSPSSLQIQQVSPEIHLLLPRQIVIGLVQHVHGLLPIASFDPLVQADDSASNSRWLNFAFIMLSLAVWMPAILLLVRQGALLTAGRPLASLNNGLKKAAIQSPWAWFLAAIPLGCVALLSLLVAVTGWIARLFSGWQWLEMPFVVAAAGIAIVAGILSFGANVAVPLGWAALVNQEDRDGLDALSRGFEYLMRRPLQLAWYLSVAIALLVVVGAIFTGISYAGIHIAMVALQFAGASDFVQSQTVLLLAYLPWIVVLTLFWSQVGGIYLLLRRDAGGQEVEDLWIPSPGSAPDLPKREP